MSLLWDWVAPIFMLVAAPIFWLATFEHLRKLEFGPYMGWASIATIVTLFDVGIIAMWAGWIE